MQQESWVRDLGGVFKKSVSGSFANPLLHISFNLSYIIIIRLRRSCFHGDFVASRPRLMWGTG
ncbi:hypothetical protein BDV25DRAFT_156279 [Aspergillus avenaceus]|uniref:Uncharacterized protein n=1 Tax=Aspergillus avenaceus TaxID=36643 RepID=A0A5N6TSY3_ASPAV|nr:hypothetical protein BDV25DRAFT_156279 [Aspergillus avenaceus]